MARDYENPGMGGLTTPTAAAGLVIGSIVILWALARGFRGVSVGGAGIRVG